ncbi:MAG: alpha/beta fold hydrolase [Dehalococcoidia bacterium]|nr:alpha/beta fold hydrolase [Dehalococcoidia bacterium]
MPDGVLLLHAFPLDHTMWEPQAEAFRGACTVVAPDFPGFGESPAPALPPTIDSAAGAAAEAMTRAGIDRAVVCGLSMGGYVALAFLRRYPARVRGLVLANTRADADDEAARERRAALAARLRSEGNILAENPPPLLGEAAPPALLARVKGIIARQAPESIARAAEAMAARPNALGDLPNISVPTLVITSAGDTLIPPAVTQSTLAGIPGARFEIIPGAGHLSNLEAPEAFNALLRDHIRGCG